MKTLALDFGTETDVSNPKSLIGKAIISALKAGASIDCTYTKTNVTISLKPIRLFTSNKRPYIGHEYVRAYSSLHSDFRVFRLENLSLPEVLPNNPSTTSSPPLSGRPQCRHFGCDNLCELKEHRNGRAIYRSVCSKCHRSPPATPDKTMGNKNEMGEDRPEQGHSSTKKITENNFAQGSQMTFTRDDRVDHEYMNGRFKELRSKLLDFSRRNPLIHFNHTETGVGFVRLVDEVPDSLLERLLKNPMFFRPLPEISSEPKDEQTIEFQSRLGELRATDEEYLHTITDEELKTLDEVAFEEILEKASRTLKDKIRVELHLPPLQTGPRPDLKTHAKIHGINPSYELELEVSRDEHLDGELQTLLTPAALDRRLRNIYAKSTTHERETGINVLHIAIGFLEYPEREDSDKKNLSPLLLLPLKINKVKTRTGFAYSIEGDDVAATLNSTLVEKIGREMGINNFPVFLSDTHEERNATIAQYFKLVESFANANTGWRLRKFVTVGAFPFSTINMYEDLFPEAWGTQEISSHEITARLLGGISANETKFIENTHDIDRLTIANEAPPLIKPADSSQHSALLEVFKGASLVIQGPPGTGKSQTITNIIAAAASKGKRVLFVAEKQPALNVVGNRLRDSGLGAIVFEPQRGANKVALLESLAERLAIQPKLNQTEYEEKKQTLIESLGFATKVRDALAMTTGYLGLNLYQLIWRYLLLADQVKETLNPTQSLNIYAPNELVKNELSEMVQTIENLFSTKNTKSIRSGDYTFEHIGNVPANPIAISELKNQADALTSSIHLSTSLLSEIASAQLDLKLKDILFLSDKLEDTGVNRSTQLQELSLEEERLTELAMRHETLKLVKTTQAPLQKYESTLADRIVSIEQSLGLGDEAISTIALERRLKDGQSVLATLSGFRELVSITQLPIDIRWSELKAAINLLITAPLPSIKKLAENGINPTNIEGLSKLVEKLKAELSSVQIKLTKIGFPEKSLTHLSTISRSELSAHTEVFSASGVLSVFSSRTKAAKAFIEKIGVSTSNKPVALAKLKELESVVGICEDIETRPEYLTTIGKHFRGLNSNMELLQSLAEGATQLIRFRDALSNFVGSRKADTVISALLAEPNGHLAQRIWSSADRGDLDSLNSGEIAGLETSILQQEKICDQLSALIKHRGMVGLEAEQKFSFTSTKSKLNTLLERLGIKNENEPYEFKMIDQAVSSLESSLSSSVGTIKEVEESLSAIKRSSLAAKAILQFLNDKESYGVAKAVNFFPLIDALLDFKKGGGLDWLLKYAAFLKDRELHDNPMQSDLPFAKALLESISTTPESDLLELAKRNLIAEKLRENRILNGTPADRLLEFDDYESATKAVEFKLGRHYLLKFSEKNKIEIEHILSPLNIKQMRRKFQDADSALQKLEALKALSEASKVKIPRGNSSGLKKTYTDLSLIENELQKQKGHLPVRTLVARAKGALLAMKPIWLMQPLAVSQFLPKQRDLFDIVIIDEASQMLPQHALGSIFRASQLVVVGDNQQMPPSNLFNLSFDEIEEEDSEIDAESILDLSAERLGNSVSLRWHYRSRHPSLIQFSNKEFYKNRLEVMPSPVNDSRQLGISCVQVDGVFKSRLNIVEAKEVILQAKRSMAQNPEQSIGIITMNLPQREYIEDEIRRLADTDPIIRDYFARWEDDDIQYPLINNLERVQGDERDVIIISTVYGPDENGRQTQAFPLINTKQGHRRLNVLFTRAKNRLIVVTSMRPSAISVDEKSSRGKRVLRDYIEYARSGVLEAGQALPVEPDSDFEVFVMNALSTAGYVAVPQVGVRGFRIDIGVQLQGDNSRYIAGIECDGATYHSSPQARDRDKIRQDILESLGWNIYRIWSTDWFANPTKETSKLLEWLSKLQNASINTVETTTSPEDATVSEQKPAGLKTIYKSGNKEFECIERYPGIYIVLIDGQEIGDIEKLAEARPITGSSSYIDQFKEISPRKYLATRHSDGSEREFGGIEFAINWFNSFM